jgi:hypothetical protein
MVYFLDFNGIVCFLIVISTAIENVFHLFLKKIGHLMKSLRKKEDGTRLTKKERKFERRRNVLFGFV